MSDERPITRNVPQGAGARNQAAHQAREVARRRTFRPTVTEEGELKAGGCTLGTVEAGPDGPVLVVQDRYRRRCQARGTDDVAVNLRDVLQAAEEAAGKESETKP